METGIQPQWPSAHLAFRAALCHHRCVTRDHIVRTLKLFAPELRENGATALFMFGSRARGTERSDSDLDLFIDYDRDTRVPNIFLLMKVENEMSRVLGIPVTITTRGALHPLMKDEIERHSVRVV